MTWTFFIITLCIPIFFLNFCISVYGTMVHVIQMLKSNSVIIPHNDPLITLAVEQDPAHKTSPEHAHFPTICWQCCHLVFRKESWITPNSLQRSNNMCSFCYAFFCWSEIKRENSIIRKFKNCNSCDAQVTDKKKKAQLKLHNK